MDNEIQEQSLLSKIVETTAVVGGAGLLAYKGLGGKYLSDTAYKAGASFRALSDDFATKKIRDINYDAMYESAQKRLFGEESTWKTTIPKMDAMGGASNNVFGVIAERNIMLANPENTLRKHFETQELENLRQSFVHTYANGDKDMASRMRNFVDDVYYRFDEVTQGMKSETGIMLDNERLGQTFKGTNVSLQQQQEMFREVLAAKDRADEAVKREMSAPGGSAMISSIADKMIDVESMAKQFGRRGNKQSFQEKVLEDQMTIREALDRKSQFKNTEMRISDGNKSNPMNLMEVLDGLVAANPELGNIFIGKDFRIDSAGNGFSRASLTRPVKKFMDEVAGTIPGTLLKARSWMYGMEQPFMNTWYAGMHDINIGKIEKDLIDPGKKGSNTILANTYIKIHDKTYRIGANGGLEHVAELNDIKLINGQHATESHLIKSMTGLGDRLVTPGRSKVSDFLDLASTPSANFLEIFQGKAKKFADPGWIRNNVKDFFEMDFDQSTTIEYYTKLKGLNKWMGDRADQLDRGTLKKMKPHASEHAAHMIDIMLMDDSEMISSLIRKTETEGAIINRDLYSMVVKHLNSPTKAKNTMSISQDRTILGETKARHEMDLIRREAGKELFLQEAKAAGGERSAMNRLMSKAGLAGADRDKALFLANWAQVQKTGGLYNRGISQKDNLPDINTMQQIAEDTHKLFLGQDKYFEGDFYSEFRHNVTKMVNEKSSLFESGKIEKHGSIIRGGDMGEWTSIKKSITTKEVLQNILGINENIKGRAKTATIKDYAKQFIAGKNDPHNITTATLAPYFMLNRLIDPMEEFGLGFSSKHKGSVQDLAYYAMTRRILPMMAGASALAFTNDMARSVTGNSVVGGFVQGAGNINIGMHNITDKLGMTGYLNDNRRSNVISQYWMDSDEYVTAQEQKYRQMAGYTPVRAGRWWSFGSSSEYRGGKIQYFQPNAALRARSNWYNESVYGGTYNRWAHSWMPTPIAPLAPLVRLMDPYYLERLHYKDRPYPMTGKMFTDNTPWGPALNATIGEILKPQVRMHGRELGGTLTDVRDLLSKSNDQIRMKARNRQGLVRVESSFRVQPVSFTPMGQILGTDSTMADGTNPLAYGSQTDIDEYHQVLDQGGTRGVVSLQQKKQGHFIEDMVGSSQIASDIFAEATASLPVSDSYSGAKRIISGANQSIFERANKQRGVITPDAIFTETANKSAELLYHREAMSDILNSGPTSQAMQDFAYSAEQVLGIYGFMYRSLTNEKHGYRLADAGSIDSFSQKFWSGSIGGHGGGFMEIARRFFPHEDHDITRVNPLRNMMPEWMPEHFKHGDPYGMMPKGDMRLPGRGYEAMYKLHPDQFGAYGAYDRMKILGDIAPWSREYKTWRTIASQTVTDPVLKRQIVDVKKRVMHQSKNHDFYPYKFLGANKMHEMQGQVNEVLQNGKFTIVGDSKVYKMAGVELRGNILQEHLKPGMNISLMTNSDRYKKNNNDVDFSTKAAVFVDGESLSMKMIKDKTALEDTDDNTAAGVHARFTDRAISRGKIFEAIGHAPLPYLHNKFMRVDSPLESWKRQQTYGSSFSTWDHPIQGFIMPSLQTQWSYGPLGTVGSFGAVLMARAAEQAGVSKGNKLILKALQYTVNPASFVGGMTGFMSRLDARHMKLGENIGMIAGLGGYAYQHLDNPIHSAINFGAMGLFAAKQLDFANSKHAGEMLRKLTPKRAAAVGAIAGVALSGLRNGSFDKERMFGPYMPEKRRRVWESQEYYDRLKYVKYMGLYRKASRRAMLKEGVDVEGLMDLLDRRKAEYEKEHEKLLKKAEVISNTYTEGKRKEEQLSKINQRLADINLPQAIINAGEYTRSAIAYKFAADSTIYGLKNNATWSQLLRALPRNDRDYFLEFSKERDPKKRKEILKYVSPYERKVLQTAWGEKQEELTSNKKFFSNHFMPGVFWSGWRPDTNLEDVQIKEIKNEGHVLSDYGFYESTTKTPEYAAAPVNDMQRGQTGFDMMKNLVMSLQGAGLTGVDVSVTPSEKPGIQMIADIVRVNTYKATSGLSLDRIF
jgi:hypothetical protein